MLMLMLMFMFITVCDKLSTLIEMDKGYISGTKPVASDGWKSSAKNSSSRRRNTLI